MPSHDRHEIKVTIGTSSILVDPKTQSVDHTDQVKWISTNGKKFRIRFEDDRTCFDKKDYSYNEATTFRKLSPNASVGDEDYKYTVISEDKPTLEEDPYIKISNPTI